MIEETLWDLGWNSCDFWVAPAPIFQPEQALLHLPPPDDTVALLTLYDDWGIQKATMMKEVGYRVEIMWRGDEESRITSGTEIRSRLREGLPWRHLVPAAVARCINVGDARAS